MQESQSALSEEEFNYLLRLLLEPESPRSTLDNGVFDEFGPWEAEYTSVGGVVQADS